MKKYFNHRQLVERGWTGKVQRLLGSPDQTHRISARRIEYRYERQRVLRAERTVLFAFGLRPLPPLGTTLSRASLLYVLESPKRLGKYPAFLRRLEEVVTLQRLVGNPGWLMAWLEAAYAWALNFEITHACVFLQRLWCCPHKALVYAVARGWPVAVRRLLALGADATGLYGRAESLAHKFGVPRRWEVADLLREADRNEGPF